jgi:type VI protein secretion system component Hcp
MNEHEQDETDESGDLEPSAADEQKVVGGDGKISLQPFTITKPIDKSSP